MDNNFIEGFFKVAGVFTELGKGLTKKVKDVGATSAKGLNRVRKADLPIANIQSATEKGLTEEN